MGTFKSSKTLYATSSLIPAIAADIVTNFTKGGYEVNSQELISGGYDISITKGNVFKAVLGMKSALKVNIMPQGDNIYIEAGVGIFGQQAIPTVISMFFLWPILLTQIWGMVRQSKLDEQVISIAESCIVNHQDVGQDFSQSKASDSTSFHCKYCTSCGLPQPQTSKFCSACGGKL